MNTLINKGFTLVETLVAITILLLAVTGPMTVAQKGIQQAYFATEQATAVFLAQEAIEAVREIRDDVALESFDDGGSTFDWVPSVCTGQHGCEYRKKSGNTFFKCSSEEKCRVYIDSSTGKYTYSSSNNVASQFIRKVFISEPGASGIAEVRVIVSWDSTLFSSGDRRNVTLQTWIYDHYQRYGN